MRKTVVTGLIVSAMALLAACNSTPSRTVSTFEGPQYQGPAFTKVLIIGMADSYDNRTAFERELAREIGGSGASATPSYTLMAVDAPIERESVVKIVEDGGFDSVLITRPLKRDAAASVKTARASGQAVRKDSEGGMPNLFRYDYEELNEPDIISLQYDVVIGSELFSAETKERVWSIEADISDQASIGVLIIDASDIIATQLRTDGLIPK